MNIGDLCPQCGRGHMYLGRRGTDSNESDTAFGEMTEYVCDAKGCGYRQKAKERELIESVSARGEMLMANVTKGKTKTKAKTKAKTKKKTKK